MVTIEFKIENAADIHDAVRVLSLLLPAYEPVPAPPPAPAPAQVTTPGETPAPANQDLYSALTAKADTVAETVAEEATAPFETRDDMVLKARDRAKQPGGKQWLIDHVLCGKKYANISAVPDDVLAKALAV